MLYTTFQWQEVCGLSDPATYQTPILTVQCHEEKEKTTSTVARSFNLSMTWLLSLMSNCITVNLARGKKKKKKKLWLSKASWLNY